MSGASMGRRRRRVYPRKFDWAEARARYAAGESAYALAKVYGVNITAVLRVLRMPAHFVETATAEQQQLITALRPNQSPCPRCERPKDRKAHLCRDCFNETRLDAEITIEEIPGAKRVVLADVAVGRIVKVDGRWGVLMRGRAHHSRLVDFWDGGREWVSDIAIVDLAPGQRILVGGIEEESEEIAA